VGLNMLKQNMSHSGGECSLYAYSSCLEYGRVAEFFQHDNELLDSIKIRASMTI